MSNIFLLKTQYRCVDLYLTETQCFETVIWGKARMEISRIIHGLYWVKSSRWSQFLL